MLRWMFALLVVANLLFLVWSRNGLASLGLGPVSESEPHRLQQQIRPDAIVLHPPRSHDVPLPAAAVASEAEAGMEAASAAVSEAASEPAADQAPASAADR